MRVHALLVGVLLLGASAAHAQPVVVDPTLTLTASVVFVGAQSARFDEQHPDHRWVGRRGQSTDGLYRLGFSDRVEFFAGGSNVAGVVVDPMNGMVFFSEDFGGNIYRVNPSIPGTRTTWVSGLHAGDDDPVGLRVPRPGRSGGLPGRGRAVLVDRGANGPDELWVWSATIAQAQSVLVPDANNPMVDPVDVALGATEMYVADTGDAAVGAIWRVSAAGVVTALPTQVPLDAPLSIELDPITGELLVVDASAGGRLLAITIATGAVRTLVTGLAVGGDEWSGLDVRPDGSELLITAGNLIYTLSRCTTGLTPQNDCNADGVLDRCTLAAGLASDCNANGRIDACDVRDGTSGDCDVDGVPDECPRCAPVEVVVVFDTSASMDDEAAALCSQVSQIRGELAARGLTIDTEILGISDAPGGAYACLEDHVISRYGTVVPGNPPPNNQVLGMCPGGNEVASEDWGRATSVIAGTKPWRPGTVRVVVPIADEGPWCGNPLDAQDTASIVHAIATATAAAVRVSPITGTGSSQAINTLAMQLAQQTGGLYQQTASASTDIPASVLAVVRSACFAAVDCNQNQVVDSCDIVGGASVDCDGNGVPDECQPPPVVCSPDAGVWVDGGSPPDGGELAPDGGELAPDGGELAPDAAELAPDAAELAPDAAELPPDAAELPGDAAESADAAVRPPDATFALDATAAHPDAAASTADVARGDAQPADGATTVENPGCGCTTDRASGDALTPLLGLLAIVGLRRRSRRA